MAVVPRMGCRPLISASGTPARSARMAMRVLMRNRAAREQGWLLIDPSHAALAAPHLNALHAFRQNVHARTPMATL